MSLQRRLKMAASTSSGRMSPSSRYRLSIFCLGSLLGFVVWFLTGSGIGNISSRKDGSNLSSFYHENSKNNNHDEGHAVSGSMHQVELYEYYDDENNDHSHPSTNTTRPKTSWSHWNDAPSNSNLKVLYDSQLISKGKVVNIGEAHSKGLLHRGIWVAVLRPAKADYNPSSTTTTTTETGGKQQEHNNSYETLLMRRSANLKTCPNAWGLCGEHSDPNESWEDTAQRAIHEELQLSPLKSDGTARTIINLMAPVMTTNSNRNSSSASRTSGGGEGSSLLVQTPYTKLNRYDLQATGLLAVVISYKESLSIQPDDEVAELQWAPISKLQTIHACNIEITNLAKVVGTQLIQNGFY